MVPLPKQVWTESNLDPVAWSTLTSRGCGEKEEPTRASERQKTVRSSGENSVKMKGKAV